MNQQEHSSQLSALFDNELSPDQAELVIRRALKDPAMRTTWGRYALIGACVRGEPIAGRLRPESDVAARVRIRLALEGRTAPDQDGMSADERPRTGTMLARGALGMAIAASVAVVSLVLIRAQAPESGAMIAQTTLQQALPESPAVTGAVPATAAQVSPTVVARISAPPSYTTPVDESPVGQRLDAPLVNYVVAHSEVAASVVRFSPLSTVMSSSDALTQDTVEMTAAEIGAHR